MNRWRFAEEQIIAVLREQEAGVATADICRNHSISSATFYARNAKFGGMKASEAKRLKSLEEENAKLKRLLADAMLDNVALKHLPAAVELKKRTLTNLYNARPQWLADAHRELDAAVAAAYGWPADISDEDALGKLLELNLSRAGASTPPTAEGDAGEGDDE